MNKLLSNFIRPCISLLLLVASWSLLASEQPDIHQAVLNNNIETLAELVSSGSDIDLLNVEGKSPLHTAIEKSLAEPAVWLIKNGANVDLPINVQGHSIPIPTISAVIFADIEILKLLKSKGSDFNQLTSQGVGILDVLASIPCDERHTKVISYLVANGVATERNNVPIKTLHLAVLSGNTVCAKALIENGADIEAETLVGDQAPGRTPLMIATSLGNKEVVTSLLNHGTDVNRKIWGENALFYAHWAPGGSTDVELYEILLNAGASISQSLLDKLPKNSPVYNKLSEVYESAQQRIESLYKAVKAGDIATLESGKFSKQELNHIHNTYISPLHAAIESQQIESLKWLLKHGADKDISIPFKPSVESAAIGSKNDQIIAELVLAGSEFAESSKEYWLSEGWYNAFAMYVERHPNWQVNNRNASYYDVVLKLISAEKVNVLKILMEKGLDLSSIPEYEYPLNQAIKKNNLELVKLIAPTIKLHSSSYEHPLILALDQNSVAIAKYLVTIGWALPSFISREKLQAWLERDVGLIANLMCVKETSVESLDISTETLLQHFAEFNKHCPLLLGRTDKSHALLAKALEINNYVLAKALLDKGADLNYSPLYTSTFLEQATSDNQAELLLFLLENDVDLNSFANSYQFESFMDLLVDEQHGPALLKAINGRELSKTFLAKFIQYALKNKMKGLLTWFTNSHFYQKPLIEEQCLPSDNVPLDITLNCIHLELLSANLVDLKSIFQKTLVGVLYRNWDKKERLVRILSMGVINVDQPLLASNYLHDGKTPLMAAAAHGNIDIVNLLLEHNADPNLVIESESALTEAGWSGRFQVVKTIFSQADKLRKEPTQLKDLYWNLSWKNDYPDERKSAIQWLLKQGAEPNENILKNLAKKGEVDLLVELFNHYPRFKTEEILNNTLIAAAGPFNNFKLTDPIELPVIETLKKLVSLGADVNATEKGMISSDDNVSVFSALNYGTKAIVNYLLENGARLPFDTVTYYNLLGHNKLSGLKSLIESESNVTLKRLIKANLDPNLQLEPNNTLLTYSLETSNLSGLELLLSAGASPNLAPSDLSSRKPLWIAVQTNNLPAVKLLNKHQADLNLRNAGMQNKDPLMLAIDSDYLDIAKYLIENGANLTAIDSAGISISQRVNNSNSTSLLSTYELALSEGNSTQNDEKIELYISRIQSTPVVNSRLTKLNLSMRSGHGHNKYIVELWDDLNERPIRTLAQESSYSELLLAEFIDEKAWIGFGSKPVKVINILSGEQEAEIKSKYEKWVNSKAVALSTNKNRLAYATENYTKVIDTRTLQSKLNIKVGLVDKLQIENNGNITGIDNLKRLLAFNDQGVQIEMFDLFSQSHLQFPNKVVKIEGNDFLLANKQGRYLWEWDYTSQKVKNYYIGPDNEIDYLAFSNSDKIGKSHVFAVTDRQLFIWRKGQSTHIKRIDFSDIGFINGISVYTDKFLYVVTDHKIAQIDLNYDFKLKLFKPFLEQEFRSVVGNIDGVLYLKDKAKKLLKWEPAEHEVVSFADKSSLIDDAKLFGDKIYALAFDDKTNNTSINVYAKDFSAVQSTKIQGDTELDRQCVANLRSEIFVANHEEIILSCKLKQYFPPTVHRKFHLKDKDLKAINIGHLPSGLFPLSNGKFLTYEEYSSDHEISIVDINKRFSPPKVIFKQDSEPSSNNTAKPFAVKNGKIYHQNANGDLLIDRKSVV